MAEAAASGAVHLLDSARVFATLEEAVADLSAVYATTARERGQGKPVLAPETAMAAWTAPIRAGEKRGILFGPERTGLANDEVTLADAVVTFPVDPSHGSLNLAQAVLLMSYEWRRQSGRRPPCPSQRSRAPVRRPAKRFCTFFDYLEARAHRFRLLPATARRRSCGVTCAT